jgi:DNA invertase Pin-like site-specific DNA recombinase
MQVRDLLAYAKARNWDVAEVYEDKLTGTNDKRPELQRLLRDIRQRKADIVLCWKLDRFFRSLKDLVATLHELSDLGVEFVSYKDNLDMTTAAGRLMLHIIAAFAEFEADVIRERVRAGLHNAKLKGKRLGRPKLETDQAAILDMRRNGKSIRKIAAALGLSQGYVQRAVSAYTKS